MNITDKNILLYIMKSRYEEINIEGWWTINFIGYSDNLGCVLCNIKKLNDVSENNKYIVELIHNSDISSYHFKNLEFITNKNIIEKANIIEYDSNENIGNLTGEISLDNRFIRLFTDSMYNCGFNEQTDNSDNQIDRGMFASFERLEMINQPVEYLIILKKGKRIYYKITKKKKEKIYKKTSIGCLFFGKKKTLDTLENINEKHNTNLEYKISYNNPISKNLYKENISEALFNYEELKIKSTKVLPDRNLNFFYFWKHPEWKSQLEHRTIGKCSSMDFTHEETINSSITKSLASSLDKLKISFDKNTCSNIKYTIVFNILYFENDIDLDNNINNDIIGF